MYRSVFAFCVAALSCWFSHPAAAFDRLVVFGDSYSDVGNISTMTGGAYPGSPYYQGRYSNGPLWIDDVAAGLGLKLLPSLVAGGTDYAYGGAAVTMDQQSVPSLETQARTYLAAVGNHADSNALYVIWGGINDLLLDWDNDPASLRTLPAAYANGMIGIITALKAAGATQFLIGQVQDAGKTPAWNWGVTQARQATAYSAQMDAAFNQAVAAGKSSGALAGLIIHELPAYTMMDQVITPDLEQGSNGLPLFGMTDVIDACYDGTNVCADASNHFFWDGVHPTSLAHGFFAQRALALL